MNKVYVSLVAARNSMESVIFPTCVFFIESQRFSTCSSQYVMQDIKIGGQ